MNRKQEPKRLLFLFVLLVLGTTDRIRVVLDVRLQAACHAGFVMLARITSFPSLAVGDTVMAGHSLRLASSSVSGPGGVE